MTEERIKVAPEVCAYTDQDDKNLDIEVTLPGVPKDKIELNMYEDSFSLLASREDFDYVTTLAFCCPVKADEAKAHYENGLLHITVPFLENREDAVKVKVD